MKKLNLQRKQPNLQFKQLILQIRKITLALGLLALCLIAESQEIMPDKPAAPYSPARMTRNGLLFISGQIPTDPESGKIMKGDITEETKIVMKKIGNILKDNKMDYSDLVKCTVFLTDIRDYKAVNQAYAGFFKDIFPAREAMEVSNLPLGASIEISGIASK